MYGLFCDGILVILLLLLMLLLLWVIVGVVLVDVGSLLTDDFVVFVEIFIPVLLLLFSN